MTRHLTFPTDAQASLDGFDGEIIGVRQFPRDVADLSARPGWARLTGRGEGMDANKPVFLGIRQCTEGCEVTATLDTSAGIGGLSMRYDEQFHYDVTVDGSVVTATMHISTMEQSWSHTLAGGGATVELRIVAEPPVGTMLAQKVGCDWLHAQVKDGDGWVTIASVDGRYLSSDLCESFTGRVVGPYAQSGVVDVLSIDYRGQDIQR